MTTDAIAYSLEEMRTAHDRKPFEGGCWFFLSHDQMAQLREGILSDEVKAIAREMTVTVQESIAQRQGTSGGNSRDRDSRPDFYRPVLPDV